jgi:hypothetical protein
MAPNNVPDVNFERDTKQAVAALAQTYIGFRVSKEVS